ncbi:ADP-ribose pyrophosphatase [Bacillus spizizenii ATCC 6633 = JCM 2499]|uniref:ADP-ribose pyrophosphatase n=1 Tax=Bacillus spizizenii (strain ATCC 23059 / NRRL B-14472 / W23) TaxID=655816 RepID=E0U237_BACSH|nr:ADP-ribose pyrophosphatase [Bacillus spizizenii]QCJ17516.1 NUDIX hydrolase [Bacillus subtilis]ADM38363.1 ADP-ribose pyrophosphatase [Bacillus spizizenii str. W23]AJW83940.1 ADP-ribose pyrophosphatase [Bacillus spizizenii]EFG90589.1 ADP-ribose pyrophosphatase [Bacillus spizizenii ATCC 6633 = JCM 2499]KFK78975.1 ADP-ribose pyrophosphatase [Bacillus spizizenii]
MKSLEEKTISKEQIFSGKVIDLYVEDVELPNGKTSKREIVKHPGAVAILAVTEEGKIIMVKQFRKPLERAIVEIPAGKLEKGEEPEYTALRELEEETGYTAKKLTKITAFYTSPGFADEIVHVFLAEELSVLEEKRALDEDEFVEVMEVTLEDALKLVESREVYDAKTAYAIQYLQLKEALQAQK